MAPKQVKVFVRIVDASLRCISYETMKAKKIYTVLFAAINIIDKRCCPYFNAYLL
jgi:hypothetical protein